MINFETLNIKEARKKLETKEFSSVELVKGCLERIREKDKEINAFITVCEDEALKSAQMADKEIANGNSDQLALLGIPIAVKDIYSTKDIKTTAASRVLEDYIPPYDASAISRLKKAGTVIIGKTNMDAWAHGSSGENSDFGSTKNPYNLEYVSGGSSSGSAAALAASMCLASTGTDTGGSIRLPASFCHLVGLKPSYGRVSRYGIIAMASSLDSIGHFTKNIYDSALILSITAGFDGYDATCPDIKVPPYHLNLEKETNKLTIGLPKEYFKEGIDKKAGVKIEESISRLKQAGLNFVEVSLPNTKYAIACYYLIQTSEVSSNLARYDGVRFGFGRDRFGAEAKRRIMLGTYALSAGYYDQYYLKAQKVRTKIISDFEEAFKKCDLLLTPVSPTLPFKLGEKVEDPLSMYLSDIFTVTANLAGLPAISLPCGFVDGLPVGFQLIGKPFDEEKLFQAGYFYENFEA